MALTARGLRSIISSCGQRRWASRTSRAGGSLSRSHTAMCPHTTTTGQQKEPRCGICKQLQFYYTMHVSAYYYSLILVLSRTSRVRSSYSIPASITTMYVSSYHSICVRTYCVTVAAGRECWASVPEAAGDARAAGHYRAPVRA